MSTVGSYISVNSPFEQSINDVHESSVEPAHLPKRTRLAPVTGNQPETKLSQLFHPTTVRDQHLQILLLPPSIDLEMLTPDAFRRLIEKATRSLEKRKMSGDESLIKTLNLLTRLDKDRQLFELELNRSLSV